MQTRSVTQHVKRRSRVNAFKPNALKRILHASLSCLCMSCVNDLTLNKTVAWPFLKEEAQDEAVLF